LRDHGISVTTAPLFRNSYVEQLYTDRHKSWLAVIAAYVKRLQTLLTVPRFDLVWIEYELLPWLPAWPEGLLKAVGIPFVVDYDDAVFHRYEYHRSALVRTTLGKKIDTVMRRADVVMVGSEYLAERARHAGAQQIECLPTAVDVTRYRSEHCTSSEIYTVGWIGTPITVHYLSLVQTALARICTNGDARLAIVGALATTLHGIPTVVHPWSEATEVTHIQQFDVGIMPLPDEPWERGKCGYKLIQYMACGRPVVASPVGASKQIVEHRVNGFLAETTEEWISALRTLQDPALRAQMGAAGRAKVESTYNVQLNAPRLAKVLQSVAKRRTRVL